MANKEALAADLVEYSKGYDNDLILNFIHNWGETFNNTKGYNLTRREVFAVCDDVVYNHIKIITKDEDPVDPQMSVNYYMDNQQELGYYMTAETRKILNNYFQDRKYLLDTIGTVRAIGFIIRAALSDLGAVGSIGQK